MATILEKFKQQLLSRSKGRGRQELLNVLAGRMSPSGIGEKIKGQDVTFAESALSAFNELVEQEDPELNILKVRSKQERGQALTSGEFFGEEVKEPGFGETLAQLFIAGKENVKEARETGRINLFNLAIGERGIQSATDVEELELIRGSLLERKNRNLFQKDVREFVGKREKQIKKSKRTKNFI